MLKEKQIEDGKADSTKTTRQQLHQDQGQMREVAGAWCSRELR